MLHLTIILDLFGLLAFCLFNNTSQMIGFKGIKFSWFDWCHPGMVTMKFGEDWSKTMSMIFSPLNFLLGVTALYLS